MQHEGRGIDTGHYTAFCHDPVRDTWLHFNDTAVKVVTPQKVEAAQVRPVLLVACSGGMLFSDGLCVTCVCLCGVGVCVRVCVCVCVC